MNYGRQTRHHMTLFLLHYFLLWVGAGTLGRYLLLTLFISYCNQILYIGASSFTSQAAACLHHMSFTYNPVRLMLRRRMLKEREKTCRSELIRCNDTLGKSFPLAYLPASDPSLHEPASYKIVPGLVCVQILWSVADDCDARIGNWELPTPSL